LYKKLKSSFASKIFLFWFECFKNPRIYESVYMNVSLQLSSFQIPATCKSTCIESTVALKIVMFHCFDKFKDVLLALIRINSVIYWLKSESVYNFSSLLFVQNFMSSHLVVLRLQASVETLFYIMLGENTHKFPAKHSFSLLTFEPI
jgi:hypothetical protein